MFTFESFRSVSINGYDDLVDLLSRKKTTKIFYVLSRGRHSYLGCMDLSVDTFRNVPQNYKVKEHQDSSSRYIFGRYSSDTTDPFSRIVDTKDIGITYTGDSKGSLSFTSENDARNYLEYIRENVRKKVCSNV